MSLGDFLGRAAEADERGRGLALPDALAWWVLVIDPRGLGRPIRAVGEGSCPDPPYRLPPIRFTLEAARARALTLRDKPRKSPRLFALIQPYGPGYETVGYGGGGSAK